MNEMAFDGIKSKLVPDEKLIACTIDRIKEKSNAKLKYSIGWVKCAAFVLVLAVIISVLPLALKNNNSNNPIVPPQTEAGESTEPETNQIMGDPGPLVSLPWLASKYSMLRIVRYTDCIKERMFDDGLQRVDGILAEVDVVFNPSEQPIVEEIYVPIYLYEENYFDYLVVNVRLRIFNFYSGYWAIDQYNNTTLSGFAFKDGKVDFSNKHFMGKEDLYVSSTNSVFLDDLYDSYLKQVYPEYRIVDGVSAEEVKSFLERVHDVGEYVSQQLKSRGGFGCCEFD